MAYDFLRTAERMLATPSVTGEGTAELVQLLCDVVVPDLPGDHMVLAEPNGRDVSLLVVVPGGAEGAPLLLNSHLDTVPPGEPRSWTATGGNPYRPRLDGDRLTGLGSADAKLDWLCKAEAIRRRCMSGLRRTVHLLGTYGEERGLLGARSFLARAAVPRAAAALVGEPTDCRLVTQHKGLLVGRLRLVAEPQPLSGLGLSSRTRRYRGHPAHSATPEYGDNAILKSLGEIADETPVIGISGGDAVNRVPAWCDVEIASTRRRPKSGPAEPAKPEDLRPMSPALLAGTRDFAGALLVLAQQVGRRDAAFSPPGLTASICRIEGHGDSLTLTFDIRALPGDEGSASVRRWLEEAVRRIERTYAGMAATLEIERDNPPLGRGPETLTACALDAMVTAGLPRVVGTKAGCTEAGLYAAAGIPSVVFGAGRAAGNIHAPNEWTSVGQLRQAVDFYVAFIDAYCKR